MSETSTIESMIWNIADYARDAIDRKDYNKIVLPFSLLRRLECALEPTRDAVVAKYEEKKNEWGDEDDKYCTVSGYSFYNISPIRLKTIGNQTLAAMKTYVESFSPNVREIFQAFDFESVCSKLDNKNLLYEVCKKFSAIDLGTDVVSDRDMTNIYEHLIQKFGDEIAEDAEDFMTPRDIVRLSVNMLFANEEDILEADKGNVRTLYENIRPKMIQFNISRMCA
ncbi:type I restriction-modification system subunit M N-terminal domain-containing protein [Anaerolactibacter massiliensis]|uniref:type I restriction-modification system subunit M N-terminal domain-containing protein n=1 Tax=Anaerolactibacter massiliensis TaxID=2044573 RepID=UPI000CF94946|nr:type I restriction-modification system subunit M N-terminal domain-containing protein [Anaerolactibacter massiliensis]